MGSVFSPYYALARRGRPADPENHVAINTAVYGPGGRWAMTERGRRRLSRGAEFLAVGPSAMRVDGDSLLITINERAVPFPRRLSGTVRVDLPTVAHREVVLDPAGRHTWRPIAPAARIEVDLDCPAVRWSGSGYVDHNRGTEPLEAGFKSWTWARYEGGGRPVVTWSVVPREGAGRSFALVYGADGSVDEVPAPPEAMLPGTFWRVPRPLQADDQSGVRLVRTLEDTPFYARSVVEAPVLGRRMTGVHESLSLDRFKSPIVQAMLPFRMPRRA